MCWMCVCALSLSPFLIRPLVSPLAYKLEYNRRNCIQTRLARTRYFFLAQNNGTSEIIWPDPVMPCFIWFALNKFSAREYTLNGISYIIDAIELFDCAIVHNPIIHLRQVNWSIYSSVIWNVPRHSHTLIFNPRLLLLAERPYSYA